MRRWNAGFGANSLHQFQEPFAAKLTALPDKHPRGPRRLLPLNGSQRSDLVPAERVSDARDATFQPLHGEPRRSLPSKLRPSQCHELAHPQSMAVRHKDGEGVTLAMSATLLSRGDQPIDLGGRQITALSAVLAIGAATNSPAFNRNGPEYCPLFVLCRHIR